MADAVQAANANHRQLGWHVPVAVSDDYDRGQYFRHRQSSSSGATSASTDTEAEDDPRAVPQRGGRYEEDGGGGGAGGGGSISRAASSSASESACGRRSRCHQRSNEEEEEEHELEREHEPERQHRRDHHQRRHHQQHQHQPPPPQPAEPAPGSYPLLLPPNSTPFARTSDLRSRSYQSAVYFGECRLRGIDMRLAEEGALEVADRHKRWWIERCARRQDRRQRRRSSLLLGDVTGVDGGAVSSASGHAAATAESSHDHGHGSRTSKRRRRKSGSVRSSKSKSKSSQSRGTSRSSSSKLATSDPPSSPRMTDLVVPPRTLTPSPPPSPTRPTDSLAFSASSPTATATVSKAASKAKARLLRALSDADGDVTDPKFRARLAVLAERYRAAGEDARRAGRRPSSPPPSIDGTWLSITRPDFEGGLGRKPAAADGGGGGASKGDFLYTLGRMAFDVFRPTHLVCSIRGIYNAVGKVEDDADADGDGDDCGRGSAAGPEYVPYGLRGEIGGKNGNGGSAGLRTYNIVVAFTVEPNQNRNGEPRSPPAAGAEGDPASSTSKSSKRDGRNVPVADDDDDFVVSRPINGVMTNYGYVLPDPSVPNRFSIWFTGGTLEFDDCQEDEEEQEQEGEGEGDDIPALAPQHHPRLLREWRKIFDPSSAPRRTPLEYARVLAAKILLGASISDTPREGGGGDPPVGSLSYVLRRPIGGHGLAYVDVLYLDDELRVMRGHRDQVYVCARVDEDHGDGVENDDHDGHGGEEGGWD